MSKVEKIANLIPTTSSTKSLSNLLKSHSPSLKHILNIFNSTEQVYIRSEYISNDSMARGRPRIHKTKVEAAKAKTVSTKRYCDRLFSLAYFEVQMSNRRGGWIIFN